jgi:nucleoside-diphosphate-sugar epimerase
LAQVTGREPALRHEPPRPGEILRNYSLIGKAKERLGYAPEIALPEGLSRTYEWFSAAGAAVAR